MPRRRTRRPPTLLLIAVLLPFLLSSRGAGATPVQADGDGFRIQAEVVPSEEPGERRTFVRVTLINTGDRHLTLRKPTPCDPPFPILILTGEGEEYRTNSRSGYCAAVISQFSLAPGAREVQELGHGLARALLDGMITLRSPAWTDPDGTPTLLEFKQLLLSAGGLPEIVRTGETDGGSRVTRTEAVILSLQAFGFGSGCHPEWGVPDFRDAADEWAHGCITAAQALGIIQGDGNGMARMREWTRYGEAAEFEIVVTEDGGTYFLRREGRSLALRTDRSFGLCQPQPMPFCHGDSDGNYASHFGTPPAIVDGQVYVPFGALQALGLQVRYERESERVLLH